MENRVNFSSLLNADHEWLVESFQMREKKSSLKLSFFFFCFFYTPESFALSGAWHFFFFCTKPNALMKNENLYFLKLKIFFQNCNVLSGRLIPYTHWELKVISRLSFLMYPKKKITQKPFLFMRSILLSHTFSVRKFDSPEIILQFW